MNFGNLVRDVLHEGYLKLTLSANNFLSKIFVPKLKETTLNYKSVLVFDILKAAKTGNYYKVYESELGGYEFIYKLKYKQFVVLLHYTNLRTAAYAEFLRLQKTIIVYIPCVSLIQDEKFLSNFESKSFSNEDLNQLQKEFNESLRDIEESYLTHMLKGATYQHTMNHIEHELIHAIDPASYQAKDEGEESLNKHREKYLGDYYGTPEQNAGKIPAEFNPFFWNIVTGFQKPLNDRTRQFLLDFARNPQPIIDKLKVADEQGFSLAQVSAYVLNLFKRQDKDYEAFMRVLNNRHHRKLLLRIFQDKYLKKKFLQKIYTFIQEN